MNKSESIKNLAAALLIFDEKVSTVKKGEVNPFFKNKYAALPDILSAIKQPLLESGLTVKQFPVGEHELTTIVMHAESGEYIESTYKMRPGKDDPQGEGSRITYQRRYALGAALGLNIDEDDDGNKASKPPQETQHQKPKPSLSETGLETAINRARAGEEGIYKKLIATFDLTEAQITKFHQSMQKATA